ncbi:molecular chaperone Tir [Pseudomonas fluorescens]|uniref:Molecular chaperone Tir n=1 Tax=Pseudomonas fluorescens TaxID=294 RepID=A0A327MIL0_PSEFL|nr:TIR domain-containing protein [Pseudomonas fluorescens]RAI62152.1 molecular chaperone Tir [Pseudomonas fluorescens]
MARNVFFSFHFDLDCWRTQQVRNMGVLKGQKLYTPNAWEEVKRKGKDAIECWIDENMQDKTCVVVLVGSQTSQRPWVRQEIIKGWNAGKGVLGIRIHSLLDDKQQPSQPGADPFNVISLGQQKLSSQVKLVTPSGTDSKAVYASIQQNIESWIENAIQIRKAYRG